MRSILLFIAIAFSMILPTAAVARVQIDDSGVKSTNEAISIQGCADQVAAFIKPDRPYNVTGENTQINEKQSTPSYIESGLTIIASYTGAIGGGTLAYIIRS